jgi:hypothetical protein
MTFPRQILVMSVVAWSATASPATSDDSPPLHAEIDRMIAAAAPQYDQRASELATDAEFLRRVYLDASGQLPSGERTRQFLANADSEKRIKLVDELLASPEHARRMQRWLDVTLMQRRPKKHVELQAWRDYLFDATRTNKSWDELTRELLAADGAAADNRAAARFLLDRDLKQEETVRDIGRMFLGRDLQCAQCHNHPQFEDYLQRHYFGISAFLNRSYVFTDPKTKQASIGEKAEGTVKFTSVFTSEEGETAPRILDLDALEDPDPEEEPYVAKPEKNSRGVPKYSRRLKLAAAVTDPNNRAYRLNIANRLWALVMGRGLVEPLDMFHQANPPTHPELLDVLADDLAEHGYDMRRTIRAIMLSQTYQRSSQLIAEELPADERYFAGLLKPLTPEQLAWSMMRATGVVDKTRATAASRLLQEHPDLDTTTADYLFRLELLLNDDLQQHVDTFVTVFASANESSRFDATAKQALFLLNGPLIAEWLQPADGNLLSRLEKLEATPALAEELYVSVLARLPTDAEIATIETFLGSFGEDRKSGLQELVRTILCSAEFRFNH